MKKILVTGSAGQFGSELTLALRKKYVGDNVIAGINKTQPLDKIKRTGPVEVINVTSQEQINDIIKKYDIDTIYHLAAILSVVGEKNPQLAWDVNINGLYNILEAAKKSELVRVMIPSSIAVFGPETPRANTPQDTILRPKTMYGVTKVTGELLGDYYYFRFGLDVRGLRYPGIISSETLPGGGTTDYAIEIFYAAIKHKRYTCFVREDTVLPMMYMPDTLKALMDLVEADINKLKHHCDFNVAAMSFSAGELAESIKDHIPEFECTYEPDFRQKIADSWPISINDSAARDEWGWEAMYDLKAMTKDMIEKLSKKLL